MSEVHTATGRRRTATARVRLTAGSGKIEVNSREFNDYFPTASLQTAVLRPLEISGQTQSVDLLIKTHGGGVNGQAGAASLAIARALLKLDENLRPELKKNGLLTRDPRMKERKKPGRPGARKRFQFSKR
ncbi:MAG: 30S ribosomal protein S9 [Chthoniobacterales bacterium]|nr:30S ribosomal protein S9 [Chthoniobacterales bacterium]